MAPTPNRLGPRPPVIFRDLILGPWRIADLEEAARDVLPLAGESGFLARSGG